jgi:hypothetical protein
VLAVIAGETVLVDGRNRRAACRIAGIKKPATRILNGEDPTAFVLSANIHRRHMTKGQRAMAAAMIWPETRRGRSGEAEKYRNYTSKQYVSWAREVQRHSQSLAQSVLDGTFSLDAAYQQARTESGKLNNERIRLRDLRKTRPDLAARGRGAVPIPAAAAPALSPPARAVPSALAGCP